MEKFKFIVSFENDGRWQYQSDDKIFSFDILNVIQYYCLRQILSRFKINFHSFFHYDLDLFERIYFKNYQKRNITELQNFIVYFSQFLNFDVDNYGSVLFDNELFTFDKLINKITEDMLINDFNKYINAYDINKYTKLYVNSYRNDYGRLYYFMNVFMGDEVYISSKRFLDRILTYGSFYSIIEDNNIKLLFSECKEHFINNQGLVDNTMSKHIVYTSDLEVIKQVLRNNQKIIANIVKNLKNETSNEASNSNKQKLMQLLTSEETKPEVKPKQRTKITL